MDNICKFQTISDVMKRKTFIDNALTLKVLVTTIDALGYFQIGLARYTEILIISPFVCSKTVTGSYICYRKLP